MKISPFGYNLLIKPVEKKQVLVSEQKSFCEYGVVVAKAPSNDSRIKVGDVIAYTVWGINSVEIENEKFYFVPEDERFILGVIVQE